MATGVANRRLAKELSDIQSKGLTPGIKLLQADDFEKWYLEIEVLYPDYSESSSAAAAASSADGLMLESGERHTAGSCPREADGRAKRAYSSAQSSRKSEENEVEDIVVLDEDDVEPAVRTTTAGSGTSANPIILGEEEGESEPSAAPSGSRPKSSSFLQRLSKRPRLFGSGSQDGMADVHARAGSSGSNVNGPDRKNAARGTDQESSRTSRKIPPPKKGSIVERLYEGRKFALEFKFDKSYPIESPQVIFVKGKVTGKHYEVPVHPHIYTNGHICASVLDNGWSPVLNVAALALTLQSMLASNNRNELPQGNDRYVASAPLNPKETQWRFHDDREKHQSYMAPEEISLLIPYVCPPVISFRTELWTVVYEISAVRSAHIRTSM